MIRRTFAQELRPFALERYFARYEFSTRYLLSSSDSETMPLGDLLALEPGAGERLANLRLNYTESQGSPALRHQIAALYEHRDAETILVHGGSQEPIFIFMNVALQRGDGVVVQSPAYQSQFSIAEALGIEVSRWHSDLSREGSPDVGELERLVRPRTRAIVLTTPNNPTGYPFDRAQIDAVVEIARRHGLWIFGDEVYRGSEREAERIPAICDLYERGISLGGLSKVHGLPGLRVGWISTRDRSLRGGMAAFKDYLTICNSAPSEFLAEVALRHTDALTERSRAISTRNLNRLDEFFARRSSLFEWARPRAGTTAFPRYLGGNSTDFCARLVEQAGVLLVPSTIFDAGDERFRIGYGRADLADALAAFDAWIATAHPA
ncbi:MAG: aminotransferase class I/II-fold pyridoxal phosphate-dependent enzyme [Candidatus Eremiobacteraeota bacterium]|nr:aminotransferase class I/II-fold pyridoxal phosphate-dependent enzyme [Candidatus Eremiobacteraeota bacterium]